MDGPPMGNGSWHSPWVCLVDLTASTVLSRSCADCKRLGHATIRSCLHAGGARLNAGSTPLYLWY
jgi:hypothetical protein